MLCGTNCILSGFTVSYMLCDTDGYDYFIIYTYKLSDHTNITTKVFKSCCNDTSSSVKYGLVNLFPKVKVEFCL